MTATSSSAPVFEHFFRMVLVGDSMVGKSSFLRQFRQKTFTFEHKPTESADFALKVIQSDNALVKIQLWDTSDSLRYGRLTQSYFSNVLGMAMGVFVMFDLTVKKTYDNTDRWLETIMHLSSSDVVIGLIGTKADLDNKRQVDKESAENLAKGLGLEYYEVSSKDSENVEQIVSAMAAKILDGSQREKSAAISRTAIASAVPRSEGISSLVNLNGSNPKEHQKSCCKTQ